MRNCRLTLIACLIPLVGGPAIAQEKTTPKETLAGMRKTVEGLNWQKVDFGALDPLERCRALMLLNHALDELDDAAVAEADLAGTFIEQQNLSEGYAKSLASEAPLARSYDDARKIASAMLKGPMSGSRYSKELASADAPALQAYEKAYDTSARRRWESFSKTSATLRKLIGFLKEKGKLKDYMTWVPTEAARQQDEYDQSAAGKGDVPPPPPPPGEKNPAEVGSSATAEEQQKNRADSRQAQQALYAAQSSQPTTVVVQDDDDWYPGWYNGAIDNMKRRPQAQPVYRNSQYQAQARARVEQRETGGAKPAGQRGGGGRRP